MANRDIEKAAACALRCLAEWRETSESDGHSSFVRNTFINAVRVVEMQQLADHHDLSDKPLLNELLNELDLIRFNETSVESLHRQGAIVAKIATRHGAAYVSNALRNKEIATRGGGRWSWEDFAAGCRDARSTKRIVQEFGFGRHPFMIE